MFSARYKTIIFIKSYYFSIVLTLLCVVRILQCSEAVYQGRTLRRSARQVWLLVSSILLEVSYNM